VRCCCCCCCCCCCAFAGAAAACTQRTSVAALLRRVRHPVPAQKVACRVSARVIGLCAALAALWNQWYMYHRVVLCVLQSRGKRSLHCCVCAQAGFTVSVWRCVKSDIGLRTEMVASSKQGQLRHGSCCVKVQVMCCMVDICQFFRLFRD
jgi:hypothetical protein